jgi:hypothetical protein
VIELLWLVLAALCFTLAGFTHSWDGANITLPVRLVSNIGALYFLNLYLAEALSK